MRFILAFMVLAFFACGDGGSATTTADNGGDYKKVIEKRLETYISKMTSGDYEEMLDLTYPKLFDIAPREMMLTVLKQTFDSEEMKFSFSDSEILKVHDKVVESKGLMYTLVDYKMKMHMQLMGEMAEAGDFMVSAFEQQFGAENVSYDAEATKFTIAMNSQMIAIKDKDQWYFLENKKEQAPILKQVVDKTVLDDLGIEL